MSPSHKTKILIIEDDEPVRQTLADMVELNSYEAVTAPDGMTGFAAAKNSAPSLIITDIAMPGMTGFELLEQFRRDENLRTIPVIVISAKIERAAMRRGMELGAADFITKPFTEDEVMHSIAARLEKKELVDELDAFAHTVAHDLRNPLATLFGRMELLTMQVGRVDEATLRHHLTEATASARRLNDIIEELLVLAGVRRQTMQPTVLDSAAITHEAVDRLESLIKQQEAVIRLPDSWPIAVGHAPWVIEVWANFISNAAKYGGPKPLITLGGEACADGKSARFWVQDRGPGLDENGRAQMFVPFTRISAVRTKGFGLGLSIVRRIVEKLEGKVGVESSPGAGARFWFELPSSLPPEPLKSSAPPLLFAP
jgi:two-component system sensor histidine kinase/response regulator